MSYPPSHLMKDNCVSASYVAKVDDVCVLSHPCIHLI